MQQLHRPPDPSGFKSEVPVPSNVKDESGSALPPHGGPGATPGDGEFGGLVSYFSSQRTDEDDMTS